MVKVLIRGLAPFPYQKKKSPEKRSSTYDGRDGESCAYDFDNPIKSSIWAYEKRKGEKGSLKEGKVPTCNKEIIAR